MKVMRKSVSMLPITAALLAILAGRRHCPESRLLTGLIQLEWLVDSKRNPIRPPESAALRAFTEKEISLSEFGARLGDFYKSSPSDSGMTQSTLSNTDSDFSTLARAKRKSPHSKRPKRPGPKPSTRVDAASARPRKKRSHKCQITP